MINPVRMNEDGWRERVPGGQEARDPTGQFVRAQPAKDYPLALQAGVPVQYPITPSRSFTLISASGGTPVTVKFNGGSQKQTMSPGDGQDDIYFDDIEFESAAAQTIVFRIGDGKQRTGTTVNNNVTASVQPANTCKATADVTAAVSAKTLVIAANANRKAVLIKSLSANTTSVRIGDNATVAANVGIELDPGETATLETQAAVYCYNASGAATPTLSILELERV